MTNHKKIIKNNKDRAKYGKQSYASGIQEYSRIGALRLIIKSLKHHKPLSA